MSGHPEHRSRPPIGPTAPRQRCAAPPPCASARASCLRGRGPATRRGSASTTIALQGAAARGRRTSRARATRDLNIPYHSRWRHFEAGGVDRRADLRRSRLDARAHDRPGGGQRAARRRRRPRLALHEAASGQALHPLRRAGRGELARLHRRAVLQRPRAPAAGRRRQACARSTPTGWPTRSRSARPIRWSASTAACALLRRLGDALAAQPEVFGRTGRPGGLFDVLVTPARPDHGRRARHPVAAADVAVGTSGRRTTRSVDEPLGDCWRHERGAAAPVSPHGWMPFHKLSQWLTYSLLEPFEWAGVQVDGPRRADRPARVPQRRPAARHRRAAPARPGVDRTHVDGRRRVGRRVARADGGAARRTRAAGAHGPRRGRRRRCRWPACSRAAPGRRAARWRSDCAAGCRRWRSTATARCSRTIAMGTVHLIDHPLVQHKLTLMRRKEATTNSFRRLLQRDVGADGLRGTARHADAGDRDRDAAGDAPPARSSTARSWCSSPSCAPAPASWTAC